MQKDNPELLVVPNTGSLGAHEVHLHLLWPAAFAQVSEANLLARYGALLAPEEAARLNRYLLEPSRRQYLLARILVRNVLSRYAAVDPCAWRFEADAHGRPQIAQPELIAPLAFNVAHTEGLVVCAIARETSVGVDVEYMPRRTDFARIAAREFAPSEVAALRALPVSAQREGFFAYWTLKEAYIKARGLGLALPLGAFAFDLSGASIRISFDGRIEDAPESWQFRRLALSPEHTGALAHRVAERGRSAFKQFTCTPAF